MKMTPPPVDPLSVARAMLTTVVERAATTAMTSRMHEAPAAASIAARMTHAQAHATSAMALTDVGAPINPIHRVPLDVALATAGTRAVGAAAVGAVATPTRGAAIAHPATHAPPFAMTGMRDRVAGAQAQPSGSHAAASGKTSRWLLVGGGVLTCAIHAPPG
jgi:hypothetical protein